MATAIALHSLVACTTHADVVGHNSDARRWAEEEHAEDARNNQQPLGARPATAHPEAPDEVPPPPPPPPSAPGQAAPAYPPPATAPAH